MMGVFGDKQMRLAARTKVCMPWIFAFAQSVHLFPTGTATHTVTVFLLWVWPRLPDARVDEGAYITRNTMQGLLRN